MARVNDVGTKLCAALGIDANEVRAISFRWEAGQVATIKVTMFAGYEVEGVLKEYELVEKVEDEGEGKK